MPSFGQRIPQHVVMIAKDQATAGPALQGVARQSQDSATVRAPVHEIAQKEDPWATVGALRVRSMNEMILANRSERPCTSPIAYMGEISCDIQCLLLDVDCQCRRKGLVARSYVRVCSTWSTGGSNFNVIPMKPTFACRTGKSTAIRFDFVAS